MRKRLIEISLSAFLTSIAVIISPVLWFPAFTTKAYPGQHMINVISGVLLGPWWAALIALFTGIIRMMLGVGTIYSIPGGIPGAFLVGIGYEILRRTRFKEKVELAAFLEPIGTVLIGGTLALYIFAPSIGDVRMLQRLEEGPMFALIGLWSLWALSSVPGCIIGYIILLVLKKAGYTRETILEDKH